MLLNDFSGGLNTRVAPSLLQPNQAQIFTNVDHTSGSLKPIKACSESANNVDKYFKWYESGQEYVSDALESSYVEYQDIMYKTNLNSYPTKYNGTIEYRLGIVGPTNLPSTVSGGVGLLTGEYTYVYTYYNSVTGVESQPSQISTGLDVTDESIDIGGFLLSSDPQVDFIRLYRLGGSLTNYTLVVDKPHDLIDFNDNVADLDIAGAHQLDTYTYKEAPNNLKYIIETYAMLFGAVGDKLYYSEIALPNAWPVTNFIDFDKPITGIAVIQSGIVVFTEHQSHLITGTTPDTFSKVLLDGEQGCLSHYTIEFTNNSLIWLSNDGVCTTTGGLIEVVSLPILGEFKLGGVNNAAVLNRAYYISHDSGILVFDFKYNTMVRNLDKVVDWLDVHDDILYSNVSTDVHSMFDGEDLEYHYKSPMITDGSYSHRKDYKDFYIKYEGYIILKLYVDGELINEKELVGNEACYNLKALNSASGYGLEIEITGTGTVSEIEYKASGRQNGK